MLVPAPLDSKVELSIPPPITITADLGHWVPEVELFSWEIPADLEPIESWEITSEADMEHLTPLDPEVEPLSWEITEDFALIPSSGRTASHQTNQRVEI